MRCFTGLVAMLFILTFTAAGFGESALPDLKGTWIMKTFPILHEMVGDGGMDIGRLVSPDKMESVYLRVTEHHSITARTTFSRKK